MAPFIFSACGITIGAQIEFCCNGNEHTGELCEVVDDKYVSYNSETWSLTALAKYLTGVGCLAYSAHKKGDACLTKPSIAFFLCHTLYGTTPCQQCFHTAYWEPPHRGFFDKLVFRFRTWETTI